MTQKIPNIARFKTDIKNAEYSVKWYGENFKDAKQNLVKCKANLKQVLKEVAKIKNNKIVIVNKINKKPIPVATRLDLAKKLIRLEGIEFYCDKKKQAWSIKLLDNRNRKLKKMLKILADDIKIYKWVNNYGVIEQNVRYYFKREDYVSKKETTIQKERN